MSKRNLGGKIKLSSYDDMFGTEESPETTGAETKGQIVDLPLSEMHTFENHPFRVVDDESMEEMVESIKEYGVLVPAIVRPRAKGGYEILSGHRRHHASTIAGLETMPAIVKDCGDDEATVIMVDANIQREDILISEKAKAYSMKYEAMKHQGAAGGWSLKEMSDQAGESMANIQRLISVASLNKELLDMVDAKRIGIRQGVDLSYLNEDQQKTVYEVITKQAVTLSDAELFILMKEFDLLGDNIGSMTAKEVSYQDYFIKLVRQEKLGVKNIEFGNVLVQNPGRNTRAEELLVENVYYVKDRYYNNKVAKIKRKLLSLADVLEEGDLKGCLETYCISIWFERGLDKVLCK